MTKFWPYMEIATYRTTQPRGADLKIEVQGIKVVLDTTRVSLVSAQSHFSFSDISTVYCLLSTVFCPFSSVYCLLSSVNCLPYTVYWLAIQSYFDCLPIPRELPGIFDNPNHGVQPNEQHPKYIAFPDFSIHCWTLGYLEFGSLELLLLS